jgi:hypothetical protein
MPSLLALLAACFDGPREVPGNLANPKLAQLLNEALDAEIKRMNPTWSPGLMPQAADNAKLWLKEIDEVVARCRYGPGNTSKFNLLEYDIRLQSTTVIEDVYSGHRCLYGFTSPLIMRVRFHEGRVVQVLTDGRELKNPVDAVRSDAGIFAEKIIRADWDRNRSKYFPAPKTSEQIRDEWQKP